MCELVVSTAFTKNIHGKCRGTYVSMNIPIEIFLFYNPLQE